MPATVLTYDVSAKHAAMKSELVALGFHDVLQSSPSCNLPNTTLYHPTATCNQARDAARDIAVRLGITLERCFAAEFSNWAGIEGLPHR